MADKRRLPQEYSPLQLITETVVLPLFAPRAQDPARTVAALWFQITDFASWEQWLPNAVSVGVLETGAVGRGSRLQVATEIGTETWLVSYWDADRRIVFQITAGQARRACAVETRCRDDQAIELLVTMEFELTGMRSLLRPILAQAYARRVRLYGENLRTWLLARVPE